MHEVSLMQSLFELVEMYSREHRLKKVTRIVVRVGELACIVPDSLQFAFEAIRKGTNAEEAEFVIEQVPARSRCTVCGNEFASSLTMRTCPLCEKPSIYIEGQELHLQTLEGDQEDET
jgi:hydrogenase nickel incorporation protein HypA/HybF